MEERTILRGSVEWPPRLEDLFDPPPCLHVRGPLSATGPRVGVVGTRRASERGRQLAAELGAGLARAGAVVISGGALGIDGAAHRGALRAGGVTWVVLPSPIHAPSPASHRRLFEEVLAGGGAWLSETTEADGKHRFFRRNRVVAALCDALVVVEARLQSGTRHTVEAAQVLGRPVGAYPWAVGEPYGEGCLTWLRGGARLVTGLEDVRALLAEVGRPLEADKGRALEDPVLAALGADGAGPEEVALALGQPVSEVLARLTTLEIQGAVVATAGGRFRTVP